MKFYFVQLRQSNESNLVKKIFAINKIKIKKCIINEIKIKKLKS